jgi:hypothetical protein
VFVWVLMIEILIVLLLAAFMVWWTMSGRRRNDHPAPLAIEQLAEPKTEPPAPSATAPSMASEGTATDPPQASAGATACTDCAAPRAQAHQSPSLHAKGDQL